MTPASVLFRALIFVGMCLSAQALQNWPEFRGPTGDGHALDSQLPTTFDKSTLKWETPVHGKGWSSPVVWGDNVWLTTATADGKSMSVLAFDLQSGEKKHDFVVFDNKEPAFCHSDNSYASCTPAIEEGFLYVHFGSYGTACVDTATGKVLWQRRDLPCDHFRGPASSPILFEDLLIVALDGFDRQYVVALDKETGQTVWRKNRDIDYGTDNGDLKKAYGTGAIFNIEDKPLLVYPSAVATIAYDPRTGDQKWIVYHEGMNASARPLLTGNRLVIISNGMGKMLAVKPDGTGDVTSSHIVWQSSKAVPRKSSPVIVGHRMFMNEDKGVMSCVNVADGKTIWKKRIGGTFAASPIFANGKLYFFSREGKIVVLNPSDTFDQHGEFKVSDGFNASPAVSGNKLIVRSLTNLHCFEDPNPDSVDR